MIQKKTAILLVVILCFTSLNISNISKISSAPVTPRFYVDDDAESSWYSDDDHFLSIQSAINQANPYDRILVYAGTYTENIIINKTGLSLFGEDKSLVTVSGGGSGTVIKITEENCDVSSLTVTNCGSSGLNSLVKINASNTIITDNIFTSGYYGIYIENCSSTTIYYNDVSDCDKNAIHIQNSLSTTIEHVDISDISENGIFLKNLSDSSEIKYTDITTCDLNGLFSYHSSNITISNCNIKNNEKHGIHFNYTCNDNTLTNNNISKNDKNGIYLNDYSKRNIINQNSLYQNCEDAVGKYTYAAIRVENSSINTIGNNNIINNYFYGIMVVGDSNIIHNNSINRNDKHGIFLFGDNNNNIRDNDIESNTYSGIRAYNSTSNIITKNEISSNNKGVYLNYYSTDNEIWNNYFHDNTVNAYDISPNSNIWNKSSYIGNNIVNGNTQNVAGNYWDDFDESSEDAVDSNKDGIIEGNKSIDIQSYDYQPISDIISPEISNVAVSPSSQSIGSYTYISATVTDNTEIKDVRLVYTDPDDIKHNISILQNSSDTIYYCNKQFSKVGSYSFIIKAKDPMNWISSSSNTFEITEGTAPSVTDNSPTSAEAGGGFIFNATVTDDSDSAEDLTVKVIWSHDDKGGNSTMTNSGGNVFLYSAELDNTVGTLSYGFYTEDSWGNHQTTSETTVSVTDNTDPTITINSHEYESDGFIHTFEISTTITDNTGISSSYIEYWINEGSHNIAEMDNSGNNYEKTIYLQNADDKVYCIVNATDTAGNEVDTKNPYADCGGSYSGITSSPVTFNASDSYDLDGTIDEYLWDFGDGSTANGITIEHSYLTNGNYQVTLTITDNDGNTDQDSTTAEIGQSEKTYTSELTLNEIEESYSVELTELFYCYDTDGDGKEDLFYDPNKVLETVHSNNIEMDDANYFILKPKNQNKIFLWNTDNDTITEVDNSIPIEETNEESSEKHTYVNVTINKTEGWIYFDLDDEYSSSSLNVYAGENKIPDDRFWRENNKVYVLDDPVVTYILKYEKAETTGSLKWMRFSPTNENVSINNPYELSMDEPTITIEYNVKVTITQAKFYDYKLDFEKSIINDLETSDNKIYSFTPTDINPGKYDIIINAQDSKGNIWQNFTYYLYTQPTINEETELDYFAFIPYIGLIIGIAVALLILFRYKKINLQSFIYFKNKKIIPFFKPLVFGPIRLNIDESNIQKAEFYVNGKLHDTITEPPYNWDFNKTGIMRPKIEAKIYDKNGEESSTGEMTFYVFNNRLFR